MPKQTVLVTNEPVSISDEEYSKYLDEGNSLV